MFARTLRGSFHVALLAALIAAAPRAVLADPNTGPGGPILVVADSANPFGLYLAEILRNEGFNYFDVVDSSALDAGVLSQHSLVILGEMSLSAGEVTLLSDWVSDGGKLIAMRPDAQLAGLLGLSSDAATLADAYLLVDTETPPGAGIVAETIQYHGAADLYTLAGAASLATLYSDATTATGDPAITLHDVGASGGQAAAFTYDLARSVVYTRQGNPAWVGLERDGEGAIRPWELFFSIGPSSGQPHWVNPDRIRIPQADEQQRLLANLILHMQDGPWPRFWYLPSGHKAAVVMTGDQHGCCDSTQTRLDTYASNDPPGCSVDDWECVRSTSYIYPGGTWDDADGVLYESQGFEIAVHVETGCANWTPASLDAAYTAQLGPFATQFPSLAPPATHRLHCVVWTDWATQPNVELSHGIRLDTTYYYRFGSLANTYPGMFTGSGMPMRFAELDGSMVDVYQAPTQFTDESGQAYPATSNTVLDRALGAEGFYGVFTANMHQDNPVSGDGNAIVASALAHGVPIVSAAQMLEWLDGRNESSFESIVWSSPTLSFDVAADPGAQNLRGMVPAISSVGSLTEITRNATPIAYTTEVLKGVEYALFDAETGSYVVTYTPDLTGPVISSLQVLADGSGNATVSWTTDEPADSLVEYGTDPGSLGLSESSAALVTDHDVLLTGLASNTTYYYRVTSSDAFLNDTTEPPAPGAPASFLTPASLCVFDDTAIDFSAGTLGADTYAAVSDDGEVILEPTAGAEFEDPALPAGWESAIYGGGTGISISGGQVTLDGARVNTVAVYGPGRSVEFVATFAAIANQHVGFGLTAQETLWAIFSTGGSGSSLQARTHNGTILFDTDLGAGPLGEPHLYRVDWNPTTVDFFIDGSLVHTDTITYAADMRPLAADGASAAGTFTVDWMRMTPHAASGSYHSRVVDSLGSTDWTSATWSADEPASTSVSLFVRTGDTPTPDGSWSAFTALSSPGDPIGQTARYLQYRADLATGDVDRTPALEDVTVYCELGPDVSPPQISSIVATPAGAGTSATVTWTTDEDSDSLVRYGSNPAALLLSESSATLTTSHGLTLLDLVPNVTYHFRVTSADASANSATEPAGAPLTFTTTIASQTCAADDTALDFSAGSLLSTYVSESADGEVILAPTEGAEFEGTALNAGWSATGGSSGTGIVTIAGGLATLNGGQVVTDAFYGAGQSLETRATLGASTNHHIGFGVDLISQAEWAIFSTAGTTNHVFARTRTGGTLFDVDLGTAYNGAPHVYRVDWNASTVDFYIDGGLVLSQAISIATPMRPIASDSVGGLTMTVDWMRMRPYETPGGFDSRVHDAGTSSDWTAATWVAGVPSSTTFGVKVRTGETAAPDGSWTTFASVASSGSSVGQTARYLQYRINSSTTDTNATPVLEDIAFACSPPVGPPVTPPVAVDDGDNVGHGGSATIDVTANDTDDVGIDPTTVAVVAGPGNGTITEIDPLTGEISYEHDGTPIASDSFTYAVNNLPGLTSNVATVLLTILPPVPPTATDDLAILAPGVTVVIDVLGNDAAGDEPIDPASVVVTSPPTAGTIDDIDPGSGAITYTHGGLASADSFAYTVDDVLGTTSNAATVTIQVADPVPGLPVLGRLALVVLLAAGAGLAAYRGRREPKR